MELSKEEKKSLLKNLMQQMQADGKVSKNELSFLYVLAERAGLTDLDIDMLQKTDTALIVPENEFDRIEHMHKLMLLMAKDGAFSNAEKSFIENIGLRMGIRPEATITLMHKMEAAPNHLLSPEEIMSVYTTFYN